MPFTARHQLTLLFGCVLTRVNRFTGCQGWSGLTLCPVRSEARSSPHPSALFRPCLRPSERVQARSVVPSRQTRLLAGGGFDGTGRAGTRSDGRKQGRNSADGCGEDRASPGLTCARAAGAVCAGAVGAGPGPVRDTTRLAGPARAGSAGGTL